MPAAWISREWLDAYRPFLRTDMEKRVLDALYGDERIRTHREAAECAGVAVSTVSKVLARIKATAARSGFSPEHDMTKIVPDGYRIKGTSTLYDQDGKPKLQWVKSKIDPDRQAEILREAAEAFASELPKSKPVPAQHTESSDLLTLYAVGDHHLGMLAWPLEVGAEWNTSIAETMLCDAVEYLAHAAPPGGEGLVVLIGDYLHYDSLEALTPQSKHPLDSDSRYPKMVAAGIRAIRSAVATALRRHATVRVIVEPGNHDPSSSIFLALALEAIYETEPRITVDTTPGRYHYYRHGKTLIGTHHGDGAKMKDLPLVMATDRPGDWGETSHRYWFTGHIHHDRALDVSGCRVESLRVLPPTDAWAHSKGYRSARDMKAIVFHSEYGEVARHTVNPDMLRPAGS